MKAGRMSVAPIGFSKERTPDGGVLPGSAGAVFS